MCPPARAALGGDDDDRVSLRALRTQERQNLYPPVLPAALALKLTSSISEEETEGTWAPSDAREIATRVWLKIASAARARSALVLILVSSSVTSTEFSPVESSATAPGEAEVRISALSGTVIGARPCEKVRKRRS